MSASGFGAMRIDSKTSSSKSRYVARLTPAQASSVSFSMSTGRSCLRSITSTMASRARVAWSGEIAWRTTV